MRFPSIRNKETPVATTDPPLPRPDGKKFLFFISRKATAGRIACPKCGTPNPAGVNFCKECGSPYPGTDVAERGGKGAGIKEPREWLDRGNECYRRGKYPEAADCYAKALDMDPAYTKAWNNKALALERMGNSDEASACREKFSILTGRGR